MDRRRYLEDIQRLIHLLMTTYRGIVQQSTWLNEESRRAINERLDRMKFWWGMPNAYEDANFNKHFGAVKFDVKVR